MPLRKQQQERDNHSTPPELSAELRLELRGTIRKLYRELAGLNQVIASLEPMANDIRELKPTK
jgi:hypothetical protein